jgi:uncharacterized protein YjdB
VQLTATVAPENADSTAVTWHSTAEDFATVSEAGLVTAKAVGAAAIVVTTVDGGFTDTCTVTIARIAVPVTGVSLNRDTATLLANATLQLTATVTPDDADVKNVTWRSTKLNVATVSQSGLVTAKAAGTVSIIVTTVEGSFTDTCTVTVLQPVTGVSLNKDAATLKPATTLQLAATVAPANASVKGVAWHSTAEAAATVSEAGLVAAVAKGKTYIVATTADGGFTDTCAVTVAEFPVTGVSLDKDTVRLDSGATLQLAAAVAPANADFPELTWRSTRTTVATVSNEGLVTVVAGGKTSIIATSIEGGWADTVTVFVENKYKLIADLNPSSTPALLDPTPENGEYWEHESGFKLWEHKEGYGHGVKITIVGECFSREDNKNDGVYETWCKKMALRLLKNDIIRNFRDYIDIYVAVAESPVSRINATTPGIFGTTVTAGTNFDAANTFTVTAFPELASAPNRSYILIANGMMGGWALFGQPAGNCGSAWWSTDMGPDSRNDIGTYWMMHEFIGHGFASLADEYGYQGAKDTYSFDWQRSGMVRNVSNTDDLTKVPWKRFIGIEGYEEVGAYLVEPGIWKPEPYSIMVSDQEGFYYNAQSRWLIYKHIYDCSKFLSNERKKYEAGEEAGLFEAFLEFDELYNVR